MVLVFAKFWDSHPETKAPLRPFGRPFGHKEAKSAINNALGAPGGAGLRAWIDNEMVRVICGPHTSKSDPAVHMTLHCKNGTGGTAAFHIKINKELRGTSTSPAGTNVTGHAQDQEGVEPILNCAGLV